MRRTLLIVFAAAVGTRMLAALLAVAVSDVQVTDFARLRDGASYLAYASAIREGRTGFKELPHYDRRVFPGYPLLLAASGADRFPLLGIFFNWLAAAGAAVLAYRFYDDERIGWAMAVLTPSYVLYSTTIMSEATVLLGGMAGIYLLGRNRAVAAGASLAYAAIARPLAASFGLAALTVRSWRSRSFLAAAALSIGLVAATGLWLWWWSGSFFSGVDVYATDSRAYGDDQMFTWPFRSLVMVPLKTAVAAWKIVYIWAHVLVVVGGFALLLRERPRPQVSLVWLASNTAIVVCIGGIWGFHEFHRFIIPALPPLFYAWRAFLPRHRALWIAVACVSAAIAAKGLGHGW